MNKNKARTEIEIKESITKLTEELFNLRIEFDTRCNDIQKEIENLTTKQIVTDNDTIKIGDLVVITNNYKQEKGIKGRVSKITKQQVTLRTQVGTIYRRKKSNVKKV